MLPGTRGSLLPHSFSSIQLLDPIGRVQALSVAKCANHGSI